LKLFQFFETFIYSKIIFGLNKKLILLHKPIKIQIMTEKFIENAINIHGNKYDYSKVDYKSSNEKVIIICKIHGEFLQGSYHYRGYGCPKCSNNGFSKPSILWLDFLSKFYNIHIQYALNDGEFLIPTTRYKADGYCKENNTIYEFHGDFWHGNPEIYNHDDINKKTNCSFKELYDKTLIREKKIKELGYNLEVIWENKWKKINNAIRTIQRKFLEKCYY
jgi:predicted nucleic-acid-binding Zn-ribbon protein